MKLTYAYVVDASVVELFSDCKVRERQDLLRIFHALSQNPFQTGDYVQRTASFRTLQVKRFGKWLVIYWPGHADAELRVVEVRRLVP